MVDLPNKEYLEALASKFVTSVNQRGFELLIFEKTNKFLMPVLRNKDNYIFILDKNYSAENLKYCDDRAERDNKNSVFLLTDLNQMNLYLFKDPSDGSTLNYGWFSPSAQEKYILESRGLVDTEKPLIYYSGKESEFPKFDAYTIKRSQNSLLMEVKYKNLSKLKIEEGLLNYVL